MRVQQGLEAYAVCQLLLELLTVLPGAISSALCSVLQVQGAVQHADRARLLLQLGPQALDFSLLCISRACQSEPAA